MTKSTKGTNGFREILAQKKAELARELRNRDGLAIEKCADQMDEIQFGAERDLAIQNVDRDSTLLREVKAALLRIRDGSFGTCVQCEEEITPKRLAAVPWAPRCIGCQEADDRNRREGVESSEEGFTNAA